jgi:hypothetical protein
MTEQQGGVSVVDDSLDQLIEAASIPSLATLFRTAKAKGALGPLSNYGEGGPPPQPQAAPF